MSSTSHLTGGSGVPCVPLMLWSPLSQRYRSRWMVLLLQRRAGARTSWLIRTTRRRARPRTTLRLVTVLALIAAFFRTQIVENDGIRCNRRDRCGVRCPPARIIYIATRLSRRICRAIPFDTHSVGRLAALARSADGNDPLSAINRSAPAFPARAGGVGGGNRPRHSSDLRSIRRPRGIHRVSGLVSVGAQRYYPTAKRRVVHRLYGEITETGLNSNGTRLQAGQQFERADSEAVR